MSAAGQEGALARVQRYDAFGGEAGALRYVLLDVFAERALEGNQLAVFTDPGELDSETMQAIARELRLSESVFLLGAREGGEARARIFTPEAELPFAGHPVLGAAAVVGAALERSTVALETGSGPVTVELEAGSSALAVAASMKQPIPTWELVAEPAPLLAALGLESSLLPVERYSNGPSHILVAAGSPEQVAGLEPDLRAVAALAGAAGVSCFAGEAGDFKTRMFAPGIGVPEDPATGSAAGPLAVHLVRYGRAGYGEQLEIHQGAELGRPSLLLASAHGHGGNFDRVEVGGRVLTVGSGALRPR
ncbi:MAG TPA: PhzF family phenazine biosynthesis protein [Solirubrobacteraceae bacterium]|jgi:trans-2,3-dihydro-3-hydroxyanthranilate isomerase|nr:PhzF family phenazine biosynthesis protein [Solirubrobacteraceae bacterium]